MIKENKMKKLLLILICLFVSTEAKSKYIALECEVKKKLYRIVDGRGSFERNVIDESFDLITLYFDEKIGWLNTFKIDKKDRDKSKYDKEDDSWSLKNKSIDWSWYLTEDDETYSYDFENRGSPSVDFEYITLNKDSGYFEYKVVYWDTKPNSSIINAPFYEEGMYSNRFVSSGVCKKIKKSLF